MASCSFKMTYRNDRKQPQNLNSFLKETQEIYSRKLRSQSMSSPNGKSMRSVCRTAGNEHFGHLYIYLHKMIIMIAFLFFLPTPQPLSKGEEKEIMSRMGCGREVLHRSQGGKKNMILTGVKMNYLPSR